MKKTLVVMLVSVMLLGTMSVAFADASWGPASIFANLKDVTVEEAFELKQESGLTFGELAKEQDVYEEFKAAALEARKSMINQLVLEGKITEEKAQEILDAFENCDGTQTHVMRGTGLFGQRNGDGFKGNGCNLSGEGIQQRLGGNGQQRGMGQMRRGSSN